MATPQIIAALIADANQRGNNGSTMSSPQDQFSQPAVLPRTWYQWLLVFGPGAIIASLTIGTGELIFSTRGGALFGYRILFLFVAISILKWGLVVASSRHMVLTGAHPYERMAELPGPRGWLNIAMLLIVAGCMPIWVSFHSGVLGNLTSWVTDTSGQLGGAIDYLWGAAILAAVLVLAATGGYTILERVQMFIVAALVLCAGVTLVLYNPDWIAMLRGAVIPQVLEYPAWLPDEYPEIAGNSVWVETTRYVGVIGGAGFDYMAYTSFLREKSWGRSSMGVATRDDLEKIAADNTHVVRKWVAAPYIDSTISFILVVAFSAVFVASGAMILGPNHKIPTESSMLNLQAEFVTRIHSALLPIYVIGAFLTMLGTLYGTLEIACSIATEMALAINHKFAIKYERQIRLVTIAWCASWAYIILAYMFAYQYTGGEGKPRILMALLTPANLFTGVLSCAIFCGLVLWMDIKYLPKKLRMPLWLFGLNVVSGIIFLGLGIKGYYDNKNRLFAVASLIVLGIIGWIIAARSNRRNK